MKPLLAFLALAPAFALGQTVSLDARGEDVREVLATLFAQANRPYALDAAIKGKLYVRLDRMPFDKALGVVLAQAGLQAKQTDGVTMILPAPLKPVEPTVAAKPVETPRLLPHLPRKGEASPTVTPLPPAAMKRIVTTRARRAPLAEVLAAMGEQAKVRIEIDPKVPAYRIDAYFIRTSLRYALDRVCKAAGLKYAIQGDRIVVGARGDLTAKRS